MGHDSHRSGLLTGGGVRGARPRQNVVRGGHLKHKDFLDVHITDPSRIKEDVPDFDPEREFEYSARELLLLAEKILLEDPKPSKEHPAWLSAQKLRMRQKREIYVASGIPDPSIESGLYWRTHPNGRPWVPEDIRRATGASFYDSVQSTSRPIPPPLTARETKPCSFEGCGYPAGNKGLCYAHYGQARLGVPLRPVKRHSGKSKLAERLEARERVIVRA